MTTAQSTSSEAWQAVDMSEMDPAKKYPTVHFVKDNGEHQEAYLRKDTPNGARLLLPTGSTTDRDGVEKRHYLFMGGIERDEERKIIGTWHTPEEVEG